MRMQSMRQYFYEPINMDVWPEFWNEKEGNIITLNACVNTKMNIGDIALLFVTGPNGGLHAIGEIISHEYLYLEGRKEPQNPCFNNKVVDIKLYAMSSVPLIHPDLTKNIKGSPKPQPLKEIGEQLYKKVYSQSNTDSNEKRIETKNEWIEIITKATDEDMLDILTFVYLCDDHTSSKEKIAEYMSSSPKRIEKMIDDFGKNISKTYDLQEQVETDGTKRYWNIPFKTVHHKNKDVFTWQLREELVLAIKELYPELDEKHDISHVIQQYIANHPIADFEESIKEDLEVRKAFVEKFTPEFILNMELEDYCIGRKDIDERGQSSFCYLLERRMTKLGGMLGANASKFGIYFDRNEEYKPTKKYEKGGQDAFSSVKTEILKLLNSGYNHDLEGIANNKIADVFKGKILSTYYPDIYMPVFDPAKIDGFLAGLHIEYDPKEYKNTEKKKLLLKKYKDSIPSKKPMSDYYFIQMLDDIFQMEDKELLELLKNVEPHLSYVDFEFSGPHKRNRKELFRSKSTEYASIEKRNKIVGNKGENLVLNFEKEKLISSKREDLAEKVHIVLNDALGYDIESFEVDGTPLHIEVKTHSAKLGNFLDFYFTANELERLKIDDFYKIYYVFDLGKKPKYHIIDREKILFNEKTYLTPVVYKFSADIEETSR